MAHDVQPPAMISVEDARAMIADALRPVAAETTPAPRAFGRTLAADITAPRAQPPADVSAMDGYAVRAADLAPGAALRVIGEARAGGGAGVPLGAGEAVRISTGAPLPAGADQVVIQEHAVRDGGTVRLDAPAAPGRHVRMAGADFARGELLLARGTVLSPPRVALAAAAGVSAVPVMRRPRIAILTTGDELVEPGLDPDPEQVHDSAAPGLSALVFSVGGQPLPLGIARDDPEDIREALASADGADLLVTVGGASVGDHDHLRRVFAEEGGVQVFEKVRVKPGKPTWFGRLADLPVLGLPGNPVSAMVTARLFLVPAIRTLLGQPQALALRFERASLGAALAANGGRETFLRGLRTGATGPVHALAKQDSGQLSALAEANVLIRRLPDAPPAGTGDEVEVLPL